MSGCKRFTSSRYAALTTLGSTCSSSLSSLCSCVDKERACGRSGAMDGLSRPSIEAVEEVSFDEMPGAFKSEQAPCLGQ